MDRLQESFRRAVLMALVAGALVSVYGWVALGLLDTTAGPARASVWIVLQLAMTVGGIAALSGFISLLLPFVFVPDVRAFTGPQLQRLERIARAVLVGIAVFGIIIFYVSGGTGTLTGDLAVFFVPLAIIIGTNWVVTQRYLRKLPCCEIVGQAALVD